MENEFALRLRQAIIDRHISASELSRLSGVGKSDISNYLNSKYLPKQDKVFLLSQALDVDPDWLMTGETPKASNDDRPAIYIPDSKGFTKVMEHMSFEDYKTVIDAFNRTYEKMKQKGIEI